MPDALNSFDISTIAKDEPHQDNCEFTLNRFDRGYQIDEKGMGPQPNAH